MVVKKLDNVLVLLAVVLYPVFNSLKLNYTITSSQYIAICSVVFGTYILYFLIKQIRLYITERSVSLRYIVLIVCLALFIISAFVQN